MKCVICGGEADMMKGGYSVCSKHTDDGLSEWSMKAIDKMFDEEEDEDKEEI